MDPVREALGNAEHFYRKLEETRKKPDEFKSNLNAFLGVRRNITWIMKKQHSGRTEFKSWYAEKERTMKEDELMAFFAIARNISTKEHPIARARQDYKDI